MKDRWKGGSQTGFRTMADRHETREGMGGYGDSRPLRGGHRAKMKRQIVYTPSRARAISVGDLFHPIRTFKDGLYEAVPTLYARRKGDDKTTGKEAYLHWTLRTTRGMVRLGIAAVAVTTFAVKTDIGPFGSDSSSARPTLDTLAPGGTGDTTPVVDADPGVITEPSTDTAPPVAQPVDTAGGPGSPPAPGTILLQEGMFNNPDVTEMQTKLLVVGCDVGPSGADGDFGPGTAAGLTTFETNAGLTVDAIFDAATQEKLRAAEALGDLTCGKVLHP